MMIRNMFVREEGDNALILCSGIPQSWINSTEISFGPVLTRLGKITVRLRREKNDQGFLGSHLV